jgi:hypothetical protein
MFTTKYPRSNYGPPSHKGVNQPTTATPHAIADDEEPVPSQPTNAGAHDNAAKEKAPRKIQKPDVHQEFSSFGLVLEQETFQFPCVLCCGLNEFAKDGVKRMCLDCEKKERVEGDGRLGGE